MSSAAQITSFQADRIHIDQVLEKTVAVRTGLVSSQVAAAMQYAVLGGGQRLRPLLALRIGRVSGADLRLVTQAAVAIELFHSASLIVDDLPCMDDEELRRGRPTVHREYGEATAVLAAFGLVALAARQPLEAARDTQELVAMAGFHSHLMKVLDCNALVGGQALDLSVGGHGSRVLAEMKTAPLFTLSARAGLLGANVTAEQEEAMLGFGTELGITYQMMDDLQDGHASDREPFERQCQRTRALLHQFGKPAEELEELLQYFHKKSLAHLAA